MSMSKKLKANILLAITILPVAFAVLVYVFFQTGYADNFMPNFNSDILWIYGIYFVAMFGVFPVFANRVLNKNASGTDVSEFTS